MGGFHVKNPQKTSIFLLLLVFTGTTILIWRKISEHPFNLTLSKQDGYKIKRAVVEG